MNPEAFITSGFANIELIEQMYEKYRSDPSSVDASWQQFFKSMDAERAAEPSTPKKQPQQQPLSTPSTSAQSELRVFNLINAYRTYGHLLAKVNPIATEEEKDPFQLSIKTLGFISEDLKRSYPTYGILKQEQAPLEEIIKALRETYCNKIGVEYMGTQNPQLEEWLQKQIEPNRFSVQLTIDQKRMILHQLNRSELFESFLHTKYVGQKRFSLEGGESLIPILAFVIDSGAKLGLDEFVIGMAHRGRLNVLSNILNKSYGDIFSEFEDRWIPNTYEGSGDVKYHKGFSSVITTSSGKKVQVDLASNPSHLEAVDPVVEGQVRAKQDSSKAKNPKDTIVPILIHGDAAIAGQGIIYETMQMYDLDGYSTGGTIHVIINNQVGFTASPHESRSTHYCTDIARAFNAPVFHVNGEDPEGCVYATMLAVEIRQKFHCDVFIELNCYRKYGHNETDEPAFTQPFEYKMIRQKKPVREVYRDDLIHQGVVEKQVAEALEVEFKKSLHEALEVSKGTNDNNRPKEEKAFSPPTPARGSIEDLSISEMLRPVLTGVGIETLREIGEKICQIPEGFNIHPKLDQLNASRRAMVAVGAESTAVDWGMAEMLAYGSILVDGFDVRLSGQDSGRGTFSHRHSIWIDQVEKKNYISLQHIKSGVGKFQVYNSFLSEYAVLGFEYGYSLANPNALVLWEAQFGDFANGAQVIIDQFIASSEQKWGQRDNLTMLLPHGYEGQGPEHSSARIERFLSLCGDENMFVVNPTTPAQFFHLLRRQVLRRSPKPLVVFTPKGLLRHPKCISPLTDFTQGSFQQILDDPNPPQTVKQLIFCSGRVFYDIIAERETLNASHVAIIRIEQLYPLHKEKLEAIIDKYKDFEKCFWVQEEPSNMGAWSYIRPLLEEVLPKGTEICFAGRNQSAASATGSIGKHKKQSAEIMKKLFETGKPSIFEVAGQVVKEK